MAAGSKGSKGFAGLANLVSDLSDLKPLDGPHKQSEAKAAPDIELQQRETGSNHKQPQPAAETPPEGRTGNNGDAKFVIWVLVIVALVVLYIMSQSPQSDSSSSVTSSETTNSSGYDGAEDNRSTEPDYSDLSLEDLNSGSGEESPSSTVNAPEPSRYDAVSLEYAKPSVGTNNVLSIPEIRWCVRGGMQIEAMRGVFSSNEGIDRFNVIVDDYNSRCGSYRYREGNLGLAQRQVEEWRASIESEARGRARQMDRLGSSSSTTPSSSLSEETGPSKAMVKEVQMLLRVLRFSPGVADGIIGPQTEGAVRAFQRSKGMHATGQINSFVLQKLQQEYRERYPQNK